MGGGRVDGLADRREQEMYLPRCSCCIRVLFDLSKMA